MLGVHVEAGPSTEEIIAALGRCKGWSRDDRKRLAYLAIFTGYIEGRKYSTPTWVSLARLVMELERFENYPWGRVAFKVLMDSVKGKDISGCYTVNGFAQALQVWVYTALPELGATYGRPLPNNPSPPILAYKVFQLEDFPEDLIISRLLSRPAGRLSRQLYYKSVINFFEKDIAEMFPKWEFDVEDTPAENIMKLMFVKKPWKWTLEHWEVTGTRVNTTPAVVIPKKKNVVKENRARPRKKARKEAPAEAMARSAVTTTVGGLTKEDIKTMFKDIVDAMREGFGTCLKEIKYLSERVEAVEKKVGITTKRKGTGTSSKNRGTGTSSQNTTSPPKNTLELGSESVNGTNTGRKRLPEDKGPDVPADDSSSKDKAPEPNLVLLDKNQSTVSDLQKEDARYQDKRDAALVLCRANSDRTRRLAASQKSPYTANRIAKVIIPNKKLYPSYNPFAPIDKKKLKELADCLQKLIDFQHVVFAVIIEQLKIKNHVEVELGDDLPISRLHIDAWIIVLRKRYHTNPQHFKSKRMCFVDHLFAQQWRFNFKDFKNSEPDQNGLGRRLPGGAWNYYAGTIPSFCQSNKVWGTDIDDIYAPVNYNDNHWIAM
ncbi:hypothetical protein IGI04_036086 [Brassica rapa subsp. trilocularis]|uniref:Ubiquitin-like protease family profile domain-containing protein n=1 Tax=Brassica rapa subsp. trilocularis TaxID=1813537 RepID=A0ABQ7LDH5_BRACM|nr:hypothetical protein IGI04_036086 [Brassica rapa subsp. trilocularis]